MVADSREGPLKINVVVVVVAVADVVVFVAVVCCCFCCCCCRRCCLLMLLALFLLLLLPPPLFSHEIVFSTQRRQAHPGPVWVTFHGNRRKNTTQARTTQQRMTLTPNVLGTQRQKKRHTLSDKPKQQMKTNKKTNNPELEGSKKKGKKKKGKKQQKQQQVRKKCAASSLAETINTTLKNKQKAL